MVALSFWGRGYATSAIKAVADYAYTTLRVRKLTAGCDEGNVGSIRAFQKSGFEIEYRKRRHFLLDGAEVDSVNLYKMNPTFQL